MNIVSVGGSEEEHNAGRSVARAREGCKAKQIWLSNEGSLKDHTLQLLKTAEKLTSIALRARDDSINL